jgi:hypothetical protein
MAKASGNKCNNLGQCGRNQKELLHWSNWKISPERLLIFRLGFHEAMPNFDLFWKFIHFAALLRF